MTSPHASPPILTETDLTARWQMLMGPLGFGSRRLYLAFIEPDGWMLPSLVDIDDVPASADASLCRPLLEMCRSSMDDAAPGSSLAVLYCRPGPGPVTGADRTWSPALQTAATRAGVTLWPTHVACDDLLTTL